MHLNKFVLFSQWTRKDLQKLIYYSKGIFGFKIPCLFIRNNGFEKFFQVFI
jgi:hypothetical protein